MNGLYDFPAREYSAPQGRWVSPDPGSLAVADLSNPQSLNRYAYVANSPLAYVDPDGTTTGEGVCGFSSCSPSYGGPGVGFSGPMEAVSANGGFTPTSHSEVPWFNNDWSPSDYKVTGVNVTVLGQTDPVTYQGTKENALQVAAGSLQAGADLLNAADEAGKLSAYDREAILDVKSIDIVDTGFVGVWNPTLGEIRLPYANVEDKSFAVYIAASIAHEGVHIINFQNGWYQGSYLNESTALQETLHISVLIGGSRNDVTYYMKLLQDKAWQQAQITNGCNYAPGLGCGNH